jgi:hypothetical protein
MYIYSIYIEQSSIIRTFKTANMFDSGLANDIITSYYNDDDEDDDDNDDDDV